MTNVMSCETAIPADRARGVKARQQAMWASGDFAVIGATLQIVGELVTEAADVRAVHKVLDVAAGSGNATLAAARRFANVTSTDYVPALLERGRRRADAEGFANVAFEVADAEALPYADASFDVVLFDLRRHVRTRSPTCRSRADARVQTGRSHQPGELDARWFPRAASSRRRQVRAASPRASVSTPVGNEGSR